MQKHTFETELEVYESVSELPIPIQDLMNKAQQARDHAYAPYSRFRVGAALRMQDNSIVIGSNQENAAYPSGLCAERVAVFHAGASHPGMPIQALAICVKSSEKVIHTPTPPCGACRQSLAEYEARQKTPMAVYFMGEEGAVVKAHSVADLLPLVFDRSFLSSESD